jgi:GNAT superfamily N-acetyltransferase
MSDDNASLRCERAGLQHAAGLLALFESAGSGCYCNYWHFDGDKNAWLERCYVKPEENRAALVARLASPELCGVVALVEERVSGWLKLTPAPTLAKLYAQKPYRGLPQLLGPSTERERVYAVGCLYVAEGERERGLGSALLAAAILAATEAGGVALEAFPRGTPDGAKLRADEIWTGPEALYERAGFERVTDFRPYPVLRLHLPHVPS